MECLTNVVDQFWGQLRNGLTLGSIYAMIALGYTLVYGVLQLINFAHSEVFMVSTVVTLFAFRNWFDVTHPLSGFPLVGVLLVTLCAAMLASALTAVVVERLAYRPLRKHGAPRLSFLISAIGASLTIQYLFVLMDGNHRLFFVPLPNILGPTPQSVPEIMSREPVFSLFGAGFSRQRILVILVAVVMLVVLDLFVHKTRLGRGIRAVAQDAETAAMMGVNIDRVIELRGCCTRSTSASPAGTSASSRASRPSRQRSSGASGTSGAPCWAVCSWGWWRPSVPPAPRRTGRA